MVLQEQADPSRGDWRCPNTNCYNNSNWPHDFVAGDLTKCRKCGSARPAGSRLTLREERDTSPAPDAKRPRVILKGSQAARVTATKAEAKKAAARAGVQPVVLADAPTSRPEASRSRDLESRREAPARSDRNDTDREGARLEEKTRRKPSAVESDDARRPAEDASVSRSEATPTAPARLKSRAVLPDSAGVVTFDVGGQLFKISGSLVRKKKGTLLAQILKEEATNGKENGHEGKSIFVDGAPNRFTYILDWYRYDEVHLPASVPVAAFLQDARHFPLPDEVVVNGGIRNTRANDLADKVGRGLMDNVILRWPKFNDFFKSVLKDLEVHYENVGNKSSAASSEAEEAWDFPPFALPMYGEKGWIDPSNLGCAARARVLALKLEERGYRCEFSETELVITLPLKLYCEEAGMGGAEAEEPAEENMGVKGASH